MHRGEVHRHCQSRMPRFVPLLGLAACCPKRPFADFRYQARFVGQRDEAVGLQQTEFGMAPANQGLDTGKPPAANVHAWLVFEHQLLARHRTAKCAFKHQLRARVGAHLAHVELAAIASQSLGLEHRRLGVDQKLLSISPVAHRRGDSHAERDVIFTRTFEKRP